MPLPTLDASALTAGTEQEKLEFGKTLFEALATDGAIKLVNTNIRDEDIKTAFESVRAPRMHKAR